jgi:hypothetical protein
LLFVVLAIVSRRQRALFASDYPPEGTHIGFHGHNDRNGNLNWPLVNELHLRDWIIRFSDGKADIPLVDRSIRIPRAAGMIHFYNPALVNIGEYSTLTCQGTEPDHPSPFTCERIGKNALDLGDRHVADAGPKS